MTVPQLPEFAPFLAGLEARRLCFPRCAACGRFHWYPKPACPHCLSDRIEWRAVDGPGTIYSFTTVRHAFDPARAGALPYIVALVTFEDAPGVRLITNIVDSPPASVTIGAPVRPAFEQSGQLDVYVPFSVAARAA